MVKKIEDEFNEEDLVSKALRPSQQWGLDKVLAVYLATAIYSPPLQKIRAVLEAYQILTEDLKKEIEVSEEEDLEFKRLYSVVLALQNAKIYRYTDGDHLHIPWGFKRDVYSVYAHLHWIGKINYLLIKSDNFEEYDAGIREIVRKFVKSATQQGLKLDEEVVYKVVMIYDLGWQCFLAPQTLGMLQNRFIEYAMPKISSLMRRMFEKLISPETWEATITILGGKHVKGGEEAKEDSFSMG